MKPIRGQLKNWSIILLAILFGLVFYSQGQISLPLFIILTIITLIIGVVMSTYKTFIVIGKETFAIAYRCLGQSCQKRYPIQKMSDITVEEKVDSGLSIGYGRIRILGIDATPKNWNQKHYHDELLVFTFEGKRHRIGMWFEAFQAHQIKSILEKKSRSFS